MVVMSLRWLVATSAWLPAVSAGLGREQPNPWGPVQTPAPSLKDANVQASPIVLTARPAPRAMLQKRDTNTCGFVNGNPLSAYVCLADDAQCLFNSVASAVGCCLTTSCNIYTACLDYSSSKHSSTLNMDRTRYCSDSDYPYCAVLKYADPTDSLSGYTIPTCDSVATTRFIDLSTSGANAQTTPHSAKSTASPSSSSSQSSNQPSSSGSSNDNGGNSGSGSSNDNGGNSGSNSGDSSAGQTPAATNSSTPKSAASSTPIGPIVGGVVGGVALLGGLGLLIFFLVRRKNQTTPPPPTNPPMGTTPGPGPGYMPPPPGGPGPYPNQPPPQSPYPTHTPPPDMAAAPGGAFDPRYSMVKPPLSATTTTTSTSTTPVPTPGFAPVSPMTTVASPPPTYNYNSPAHPGAYSQAGTPPPQFQQQGPHPGQAWGVPPPPSQPGPGHPSYNGNGNGGYVPYPGPGEGQAQAQQGYGGGGGGVAELPVQRGDGQVHELS